ncbi:pleckstrin homology domain-containing family A member 2 [Gastrophryne carolinensis]
MPYVDRYLRTCGFLDIEDAESGRFLRRYFILDKQANYLVWYMDNPQNLPPNTGPVGSLKLTYISKVGTAAVKQKTKMAFCFVINALSQRYILQASDQEDLRGWVEALNSASKITVPRPGPVPLPEMGVTGPQDKKTPIPYKMEIIGGVVVQTPLNQNGGEGLDIRQNELASLPSLQHGQSYLPVNRHLPSHSVLKSGYCVKQGNMRKNWKRRYFALDMFSVSYYKCEKDREPLRSIRLRDILKTHECLVKSGDLLMRDNLFEVITAPRTFYIQADSPQEMHSWIKEINSAIQAYRMRHREPIGRTMSLNRSTVSSQFYGHSSPYCDDKRPLGKSTSLKSSWQPWTPVPKRETEQSAEVTDVGSHDETGGRVRHWSEPQGHRGNSFRFRLDDKNIRTSNV